MIAIYLHIPYCRTICPYCDFVKTRSRTGVPEPFVDALCREIDAYDGPGASGSVFLGGGTPSMLSSAQLGRVLAALRGRFRFNDDAEWTVEANPDDVDGPLVQSWRDLGINRVSLGVQSFDKTVLRYLGRRHNADKARAACDLIGDHFDNWNLDLIYGAPPVEAWAATLDEARRIGPPHIAAYSLTYEEGTPFEKRQDRAVDDETALDLFLEAEARLDGYRHYEISNYARPGFASAHNLVYWHNGEYAGFGTGAYSYYNGVRARNHPGIDDYMTNPGEKCEALELTPAEIRVETVIQYLRLQDGLPHRAYAARFGNRVEADFPEALEALLERGLVENTDEALRPTALGFQLNNEIGLALLP